MFKYRRIRTAIRRRLRRISYYQNSKKVSNTRVFPLVHILVLAMIICQESSFLSHYEALLHTCQSIEEDTQAFRKLDISNDVLEVLWEDSLGNMDSFVEKITMNMLLNGFSLTKEDNLISKQWFPWETLIPKSLCEDYAKKYKMIFSDLVYFPVAKDITNGETVSFEDSWMTERTYGGTRQHEGTDIMAGNNVRGYFPVISVSNGVVEQKGWLEQGGYRIGIRGSGGAYFYYAHLDSYAPDLEIGDTVVAGDLLGMMGDSGYGKEEGTKGKFDVHLHFGIYLTDGETEMSINSYWILKYLENKTISFQKTS